MCAKTVINVEGKFLVLNTFSFWNKANWTAETIRLENSSVPSMRSLNSMKQPVVTDSYYCPMMAYWELTWLWGHQRSFKENIKDSSHFQIIYYSKIMMGGFSYVYKN